MERIKEIKISFSDGGGCPTVEVDGEQLKCIVRLKLDWDSQPNEHF